jgi:prepilin-type N-terminal cleavage/methylation domain-containing protein
MRRNQGFTLIELMIVIAIIAIIAAIAIPGLLSSQRASNERNASASLKTLASAEADFRGNDRDGNGVQDFYTGDVAGLFTLAPIGVAESIKLIELSVALADASLLPFGAAAPNLAGTVGAVGGFGIQSAKAAYWYRKLTTDETGVAYALVTNGRGAFNASACFNTSKFGFCAFPDTRSSGRNVFFINEGNTIYKRGVTAAYTRPGTGAIPNGAIAVANLTGAGGNNPAVWPTDALLATDYSKMD